MAYKITQTFEPNRIQAECTEPRCGQPIWRARNSSWPVSAAKLHTKASGHITKVTQHKEFIYEREEED